MQLNYLFLTVVLALYLGVMFWVLRSDDQEHEDNKDIDRWG